MRLLIAEDDQAVADVLGQTAHVLWPGCAIDVAPDGATALRLFAAQRPDLVLLDVTMPPPDGFEVCRRIREADLAVPILILTGRATTLDEVRGLDVGADAYLTKPFDHLTLLAHLRALARRARLPPKGGSAAAPPVLALGDLTIDLDAREVCLRGQPVVLTPTEWVLLEALARDAGSVVPHEVLLSRVWGESHNRDIHYLKVVVNRLRRKLGDAASRPRYIQTRRGVGYRLVPVPGGRQGRVSGAFRLGTFAGLTLGFLLLGALLQ